MKSYIVATCLSLLSLLSTGVSATEFDYFNGDFESAKVKAGEEGKLFFVDFYANWCTPCKWMEETTFQDVEVNALLKNNYVSVKVDIDNLDGFGIKEKYQIKILPTMLIFNSKGEMVARIEETLSPRKLAKLLSYHNTEENKIQVKHTINTSPSQTTTQFKSYSPSVNNNTQPRITKKPANQKYRIQLGVFKEFENTYDMVNKLKKDFLEPVIVLNEEDNGEIRYKVLMGEFDTKEEAEGYKIILKNNHKLNGIVK